MAAAVKLGLRTGGWAPKGYRTQNGSAPFLATLGLREHPSWEYPPRTRLNVAETDGTFLFGRPTSPGCKLTVRLTKELEKPLLIHPWQSGDLDPLDVEITRFRTWIREHEIRVMNVAGNRENMNPGITVACYSFLLRALGPA